MTFLNTFFLITISVLSLLAIGLESSKAFVSVNSGGEEVAADASDPLETFGLITNGKSKSEAAISAITKEASLSIKNEASLIAINAIEGGLKAALLLIGASSDVSFRALASAKEISCNNPEAAIKHIQKELKTAQQLMYTAGLPVSNSFYAAGVLTGDKSKKSIKFGYEFVQHGGTYTIASLRAAEALSTHGLQSNSLAATKGLDAAQEVAIAGYEAAFKSLVLAGKSAFKGLSAEDGTSTNEKDKQVCKIRTPTTRSAEANAAKSSIISNAEEAVKSINQGSVVSALNKIEDGLLCGIEAAAAGEASALIAITIATQIFSNEPDIALATFKAGVTALKMGIQTAGIEAFQGLDEAAKILGNLKINKIVSAYSKVQNGTTLSLADIETAEKLASIAMKIGGDVAEQALKAVNKSFLAILFVFYSVLVRIGEEAF